jgi:hypothetical protein
MEYIRYRYALCHDLLRKIVEHSTGTGTGIVREINLPVMYDIATLAAAAAERLALRPLSSAFAWSKNKYR